MDHGHSSIVAKQRRGEAGPRLNRYYSTLKPYYRVQHEEIKNEEGQVISTNIDKTLVFESRFESGNLRKAIKVNPYEYELYMKNDYGTQSYNQWFYFRVQNTRAGATYRFHLTNMMKPTSTYNNGMRPLAYSVIEAEKSK